MPRTMRHSGPPSERAPALAQQPGVFRRDQRDREAYQRLDRHRVGLDDAKRGEAERDAVCHGEGGHECRQLAQRGGEQEQRDHERQMVPARQDVVDANGQIARDGRSEFIGLRGGGKVWIAREPERELRVRVGEHAVEDRPVGKLDTQEVEVRGGHIREDA